MPIFTEKVFRNFHVKTNLKNLILR